MANRNPYSPVPKAYRESAWFSDWTRSGADVAEDSIGPVIILGPYHNEDLTPLPADYDYYREWNASRDYFRDVKPEDAPLPTEELLGSEAGSAEMLLPTDWDALASAVRKVQSREASTQRNKAVDVGWAWPEPPTPACECWRCKDAYAAEQAMLGRE